MDAAGGHQQALPQDWETCKENFKPRRQGYSAESVMNAAVETPLERLAEEERAFEEAVFTSGGADPLDTWKQYIAWAEDRETSADYQIDVARLLERCIKRFERDETVRNDERFLKICLKYADRCDEPFQIFTFLFDRRIGILTPLFWLTWSVMFESIKNYDEAVEKLERGIYTVVEEEAKAFLSRKLTALKQRVEYQRQREAEASPEQSPTQDAEEEKSRQTFSELPQTRSGRLPTNRAKFSRPGGRGLRNVSNGRPLGVGAKGGNSTLQIYQDDGAANEQQQREQPVVKLSRPGIRPFPDTATAAKENQQDGSQWRGGLRGRRPAPSAPSSSAPLEVYEDEDVRATTENGSPAAKLPKATRRKKMKKALKPKKLAGPVSIFRDYARERGLERELPGMYLMYDPKPLLEDPGNEYCFEELRATHWLSGRGLSASDFPVEDDYENDLDASMDMGEDDAADDVARDDEDADAMGTSTRARTPAVGLVRDAYSAAQQSAQVDAAFTAPEANRRERRALRALPNAPEESEPETTVTKRLHFSVLDQDEQHQQQEAEPQNDAPSPTINTKAAMADVMAMFGGALSTSAHNAQEAATQHDDSRDHEDDAENARAAAASRQQPLTVFQDLDTGAQADDEEEEEDKENRPPLAAKQPKMTAAQEASMRTGQPRSVLGALEGFDLCSAEELAAARAYQPENDDDDDVDDDDVDGESANVHGTSGDGRAPHFSGSNDTTAAGRRAGRRPLGERAALPTTSNDGRGEYDDEGETVQNGDQWAYSAHMQQQQHVHRSTAPTLSPILEASHEISSSASFLSSKYTRTPSAPSSGQQSELTTPTLGCTTPADLAQAIAPKCRDAVEASSVTVAQSTNVPALKTGQVLQKIVPDCTLSVWKQDDARSYLAVEYDLEEYDSSDVEYLRCFKLKVVESMYEARMALLVLDRLKQLSDARLKTRALASVSVPVAFHAFKNGVVMCSTYSCKATMAELLANNAGKKMTCDETLVMFYTIELLRTLEALHTCGFVAGNVQPENILLRCDLHALEEEDEESSAPWNAQGANGWKHYGVLLTNFTNTVDVQELPRQSFEEHSLLASQGRTEGAFERDYIDLASVVHQLLFGTPIEIEQDADTNQFKPKESIRPYWQGDLWTNLFATLLNAAGTCDLQLLRRDFEGYLESNSYKSSSLHGLLIRQDLQLSD